MVGGIHPIYAGSEYALSTTYISTWAGFCYMAFRIDALEMAIGNRRSTDLAGLVHHSDRGVQCRAIRYTERLADAGTVTSVSSSGAPHDNALVETVNGLYKSELIRPGTWRTADQAELATAAWVAW